MNAPNLSLRTPLDRRTFLRGTGAAIALPFLNAMAPSVFAQGAAATETRRRFDQEVMGSSARHPVIYRSDGLIPANKNFLKRFY